jgi:hypothetical protein
VNNISAIEIDQEEKDNRNDTPTQTNKEKKKNETQRKEIEKRKERNDTRVTPFQFSEADKESGIIECYDNWVVEICNLELASAKRICLEDDS